MAVPFENPNPGDEAANKLAARHNRMLWDTLFQARAIVSIRSGFGDPEAADYAARLAEHAALVPIGFEPPARPRGFTDKEATRIRRYARDQVRWFIGEYGPRPAARRPINITRRDWERAYRQAVGEITRLESDLGLRRFWFWRALGRYELGTPNYPGAWPDAATRRLVDAEAQAHDKAFVATYGERPDAETGEREADALAGRVAWEQEHQEA